MIDCIAAKDGNIQVRLNSEVLNVLNRRLMFIDREDVDRTFAYTIFTHGMQLDQVEKFLMSLGYHSFSNEVHALFLSLTESRDNIYEHLTDYEYLKRMAYSDYTYSLVLWWILQDMNSPELADFKEYSRVYSLEKSYDSLKKFFES